ncbi:RHS repeat-associated core domain-containing protein [Pseudomonas fluorescens]|uniref:RHS repeat-associated core domain-containing protein n=1 Tax=Pseudomonas fluorescens TaxID=294 RepID=A0A5E7CHI5_PSEFL|nr:RHS repeat-associated core domain-containing protein [Pseudomonas fluorescens]VVN95063.1 hypothetical protein PS710_02199 [Pseudomonas fluorescens]
MTSPRETVLCQYHYDPLDRLTSHALPDTPEHQRFYCKSRLATEIQGAIRYSIVQHGDQLLAQQRREGDAPDTMLLVTDKQRSVLQTLKANHPPQPIAYSPYGHRPVESGLLSLLGFNGERPDPVTGCYLLGNGYRVFNPVLMRFNSPDSLSPFGKGGVNAYAYCEGEPVLGNDPTGRWKIPNLWKGVKNLFGRTPSKFRTPPPVNTQKTANPIITQASSNTASTHSGLLDESSVKFQIPRIKLNPSKPTPKKINEPTPSQRPSKPTSLPSSSRTEGEFLTEKAVPTNETNLDIPNSNLSHEEYFNSDISTGRVTKMIRGNLITYRKF